MITAFLQIFGRFLLWLYDVFGSYALALIIFTFLTKVVLFPLSYKSKKSMMQTTALQGQMQQLEKQFGKDKQRYQQEVTKLYEKEGVNPMGGCLWSFAPLIILMGLYYVIRRPLLYMMCISADTVTAAIETVTGLGYDLGNAAYQEIHLASLLGDSTVMDAVKGVVANAGENVGNLQAINFNLFGIDLSQTPNWQFWTWDTINWNSIGLFIIPIVVTALNFFYSRYSTKTNAVSKEAEEEQGTASDATAKTNRTMMYVMPLMYLWFGYIMPASMCVYMAFNAIFSMVQDKICSVMLRKKFAELEEQRKAREAAEKEEEKRKRAEAAERKARQIEENKKNRNKKKKPNPNKTKFDNSASAVGIRAHARGRSYDPDRYGGVTPYKDPNAIIDEEAVERALAAKAKRREKQQDEEDTAQAEYTEAELDEAVPAENAAEAEEDGAAGFGNASGDETAHLPEPEGNTVSGESEETAAPDGQAIFDELLGRERIGDADSEDE